MTSLWEDRLTQLQNQTATLIAISSHLGTALLASRRVGKQEVQDNSDKDLRSLTSLITATGTAISLEEKTHARLDQISAREAETVGTAEDKIHHESRTDAGPSLHSLLEETARLAHSYLAEGGISPAASADAAENGGVC